MKSKKVLGIGMLGFVLILSGCCALFNKPPIAEFTFSPQNPLAGQVVLFDASLSLDPEGKTLEYKWSFGNTTTGWLKEKTITHVFEDNGTYPVTLFVRDSHGATNSVTKIVDVGNPAPVITQVLVSPAGCRIEAGDTITFEVKAFDPAGKIEQIRWNFGDGQEAVGEVVRHCYSRGCQQYSVTVTVVDDDGASTFKSLLVYVYPKNGPPTPVIQISPEIIYVNDKVTFDGSQSHDNDLICVPCCLPCSSDLECNSCTFSCDPRERIVSWRWWIKSCNDSQWQFLGYGSKISFVPKIAGRYLVKLEVKDDDECNCCKWFDTVAEFQVLEECLSDP